MRKAAALGPAALNVRERLIYELWLFDTEQRNGGVSQYFCNRGLDQWDSLSAVASSALESFAEFAAAVNRVIGRSADPYLAVINAGVDLDAHYESYRVKLIGEARARAA